MRITLTVYAMLISGAGATDLDREWAKLGDLTHNTEYTFVLRDGSCVTGASVSVNSRNAVLRRDEVLRITEADTSLLDVVFNAKNSWGDLSEISPRGAFEHLRIIDNAGRQHSTKLFVVYSDSILLKDHGAGHPRRKSEIKTIYYIRMKPVTSTDHYLARESVAFFSPHLWFGGLFLGTFEVLVYDSSVAEDSSPLSCRPAR